MTCSLPEILRPFLHRRTAGVSSAKEVRGARRRASDEGRYVMGQVDYVAGACRAGDYGRTGLERRDTRGTLGTVGEWNCRVFRCGSRLASRVLLPLATGRLVLRILACRGWRLSCITLQLFELLHLVFCLSRFSLLAVESRQTEMRLRRQWTLALNR